MARILSARGHLSEHVREIDSLNSDDSAIWDYALRHDAIIISKDEDFPHRFQQSTVAPVIVWLRIGNASRRALLEWFDPLIEQIVHLVEQGERLIEIR